MGQMEFSFEPDAPAHASAPAHRDKTLDPFSQHLPTPRHLVVPELCPTSLARVTKALNLPKASPLGTLVSSMVVRRGWDSQQHLELLTAGLSALPDPRLLKNFESVVARICRAFREERSIAVVGDFDVDGITALSIFARLFQSARVSHTIIAPNRFTDGFGISDRIVEQLVRGDPTTGRPYGLVLLVDHGSQAHPHIAKLRAHGIDVAALDHHEVHGPLPDALVINPRQPGCGWNAQYPCAAGLAQLVASAVASAFALPQPDYSLAGIGTIADMVPLTAGSICNRIITRVGLSDLRRTTNPGILALAEALGINRDPQSPNRFAFTSEDIAFLFGPTLNAQGRLADANMCVELLTTDRPERAEEIATLLVRTNTERKRLEGSLLISSLEKLSERDHLPHVLAHFDEAHHPGLNGLLAQRLAQRWGRPAFVCAPKGPELVVGSGRAGHERYSVFSLLQEANSRANASQAGFAHFGGHQPAGGATLRRQHLPTIDRLLNEICTEFYGAPLPSIEVAADCQMRVAELTPDLFAQCEALLEPFGNRFAGPQILVRGVRIEGIRPPRNPGGRFTVSLSQGRGRIDALIGSELWGPQLEHGATLDIVAAPIKLYRNEERFVQLSVSGYVVKKAPEGHVRSPKGHTPATAHVSSDEKQLTLPDTYTLPQPQLLPMPEPTLLGVADDRPTPGVRSAQPKRLTQKLNELKAAQGDFDSRYLYPHLAELEPDYFSPKPAEFYAKAWQQLCDKHGLEFDYSKLELRPEVLEFIEYFFDKGGSHILQAPTNSGKTKISLMIASHFVRSGHRAVFVAPTREIAQQVYADLQQMFGPNVSRLLLLGGAPAARMSQLSKFTSGYIVGTAATIRNDVKNQTLVLDDRDLLIVDECHHATGKDSAVPIIEHAKHNNCLLLFLSATPWQVKHGESLANVEKLLTLAGTDLIFPLNRPPHSNRILVQFCKLSPEMRVADFYLRQAMATFREELLLETDRSIRETASILGHRYASNTPEELRSLSPSTLDTLRNPHVVLALIQPHTTEELKLKDFLGRILAIRKEAARTLVQPDGEYVSLNKVRHLTSTIAAALGYKSKEYWLARGAMELTLLHRVLINDGVTGFLLRSLEKRCSLLFPKPLAPKDKRSAWGEHMTDLYVEGRASFVEHAFGAVAPGEARMLWQRRSLEDLFSTTTNDWFAMTGPERSSAYRTGYPVVKRKLLTCFDDPQFFSHPADEFIFHDILRHGQKSFIWVEKIEQVKWLTTHMSRQFGESKSSVVGLTGAGRPGQPGMTGRERDLSLGSYRDDPKTRVIIGTTALNEGIDVQGGTGYERSLKGSFIQSTQKAGRPGRRDRPGEIIILCGTHQHYRTVISNITKSIENQKMLNSFRAAVVASVGLPPLASREPDSTATPQRKANKAPNDEQPWLF